MMKKWSSDMEKDFETAFDAFLERSEYDAAEDALFAVARGAFLAGWEAAGGGPVPQKMVLRLLSAHGDRSPKERKNP